MALLEDAYELIDELQAKLKIYRSVGNYTLTALETATEELDEATRFGGNELLDKRRTEVYKAKSAIEDDLENQ